MPSNSVHQFNPSACQADFTYTMTPVAVEIQDTGKGKKSVADDLEAVLRKTSIGTKARPLASASKRLEIVPER
jgi:hypothetical protein